MGSRIISWDELATIYDRYHTGRRARTLPMEEVAGWASNRPDLFRIGDDGSICVIENSDSLEA